jgi:hypothetical protein
MAADPDAISPACEPRAYGGACGFSREARSIAGLLSEDGLSRGARAFVQSSLPGAFTSRALADLCSDLSRREVGLEDRTFTEDDVEGSIERMVSYVMGLPPTHPRHDAARAALTRMYELSVLQPACTETGQDIVEDNDGEPVCGLDLSPQNALRQTFALACSSAELAGMGL